MQIGTTAEKNLTFILLGVIDCVGITLLDGGSCSSLVHPAFSKEVKRADQPVLIRGAHGDTECLTELSKL